MYISHVFILGFLQESWQYLLAHPIYAPNSIVEKVESCDLLHTADGGEFLSTYKVKQIEQMV